MNHHTGLEGQGLPGPVARLERLAERFETPCGDGALVWRRWGSGPPLLLLHGSHGSWAHWIHTIDALAPRYTLWVPDLPGCGESALPPAESHEAISAVLADGLRQLAGNALPVTAVGFSFGGVLAAFLSVLQPGVVERLVLVGTGGLDTPVGTVNLTGVRRLDGEARRQAHRHNLLNLMLHHDDSVDELALYLQELNGLRGRINPSPLVLPDRLLEALRVTTVPFDAIWGEFDRPHPDPAVQEQVLRSIRPELDFRVVADAGHWAMYERPEAFNAQLVAVLDESPRDPGFSEASP